MTPVQPPKKNQPPLGVVILAAGASSRMGRPKLLLPWQDTTVIGHIISQWHELGTMQIVVVHRPNDAALLPELEGLNFPARNRVENPQPERGMFSSILCAANWNGWNEKIRSFVIVLGDQPHLRLDKLRELLDFHALHADSICQPLFEGRERHPVILPRAAFEALMASRAGTLKDFLKLIACPAVQYPVKDSSLALDMDTPEDYKRLKDLTSAR
jgi:molybdenum cofactor cytidylyltransferase